MNGMRARRTSWPLRMAAAAVILLALDRFVLSPLHARGVLQEPLSRICGAIQLMDSPGRWISGKLIPADRRHPGMISWSLAASITAVLAYGLSRLAAGAPRSSPEPASIPTEAISRRRLLRQATIGLAGAGSLAGGHGLLIEPRRIKIVRLPFRVRGLHRSLGGLRLVHLTDIHMGPWVSFQYVRRAVEIANGLDPDLILLTGDYVHRSPAYIDHVAEALRQLRARIGVAGVLGNHDFWEGAPQVRAAFARAGLPLIDNNRRLVTPDRQLVAGVDEASEGLCVAGIGDLWEDTVDFDRALGGVPEALPRILLSHNPDAAEEPDLLDRRPRIDLMLCGHTHGGQVRLPFLGTPVVPSRFGAKYARGLVDGPLCPVFVSSGIGMTVLPVRWGVRPEIALIELEPA